MLACVLRGRPGLVNGARAYLCHTHQHRLKEQAQDKREARAKAAALKNKEVKKAEEKKFSMPVEYNSDRPSVHIPEVCLLVPHLNPPYTMTCPTNQLTVIRKRIWRMMKSSWTSLARRVRPAASSPPSNW